ncbi:shikimate dehydrogenase [Cesiribacter sp. SM1]|uniref:shikimate dehydrogenase family protein n=1 Tax=Cesiribacter sp. SM1 TaxID=2861196 RepID=UPI001CD576FF|nr:shikimate dehydrogenase [Cesiribacter sp. SM1]
MRQFGLIGYPLGHSFSKGYFTEKFKREGINDAAYELYPLQRIDELPQLVAQTPQLAGLNVTIPYKEQVIPYLSSLHDSAQKVGAVNVIKREGEQLIGYNSDYFGFKLSLQEWLGNKLNNLKALVLGTGGAAKAVGAALDDLEVPYQVVSRQSGPDTLSYAQLHQQPYLLLQHRLIINTTPLGMQPNLSSSPDLPYEQLGPDYYLYDLVYNPAETQFMKEGTKRGASAKNGLQMLHLQAEKAWKIWNGE